MKTILRKTAILLFAISLSINVQSQIDFTIGFGLGHSLNEKININSFAASAHLGAYVLPINYNLAVNIDTDVHYSGILSFSDFQLFAPITANISYGAGASPYADYSFGCFAGAGLSYILESKEVNGIKELNKSLGVAVKYGFRFYMGDVIITPNITHGFNLNTLVPNQIMLNLNTIIFL